MTNYGPPTSTDWWRECRSLRSQVDRLRTVIEVRDAVIEVKDAEIGQLKAALRRYGLHDEECAHLSGSLYGEPAPCSCGLSEVLQS